MHIETVNLYRIPLPFQGSFAISRVEGRSSIRVVVEVIADQGRVKGYGEGVPIEFVTGETADTVMSDVSSFISQCVFPGELEKVSQIWDFVDRLPPGKEHHAAVCATEMALLDALGKEHNRSVLAYLPQRFSCPSIRYGASITLGDRTRIEQLCGIVQGLGVKHLRIKMGSDFERNQTTIETVSRLLGSDYEKRVDPNGVWDVALAMRHLPLLAEHGVKVIEEPMARGSRGFPEFAEAARARGLILMACESAPTLDEVKSLIEEGHYRMFNVKLCRSGGFLRTLRIIDHLRREGIAFQIGCTLGEGGLLSAAGRALGLVCSDAVTYDGSYDRFVLKENITEEDVGFGPAGNAGPLTGSGLGVTIRSERLARLSEGRISLPVK